MSSALISIVIPVLNEAGLVTGALQALQDFRRQGHEVIVVDGGSTDETRVLATSLCDQLLVSRPGRARQMNLGASSAGNDTLLFLHLDTWLPANAPDLVTDALNTSLWGRFDVILPGGHFLLGVVARAMNLRSRLTSVATGDQAIFVRRRTFEAVCGFPAIALMEDVAFSKAMRKQGRPACLQQKVVCSSRRWQQHGTVKTILLMWWLRLLYFAGIHPDRLAHWYYPGRKQPEKPQYPDTVLLMFARPPRRGQVKTRLARDIGEDAALNAYTSLLFRQLSRVAAQHLFDVQLWTDQASSWFSSAGIPVFQQTGEDLGARMANAAREGLSEYRKVILIGSDCPGLDQNYLLQALEALESHQVVIGPAADGGYVLLGLGSYTDQIFRDMPWSTEQVLPQTLQKLKEESVDALLLPVLEDIDTISELNRAVQAGTYITGN